MGPYSTEADLDSCARFIQKCLRKCRGKHKNCRTETLTTLPTRVVSIGKEETDTIKLLQFDGKLGQYATLSHCWGGRQPFKTTQSNLTSVLSSIQWESLPIVFQQAILLARRLDIEYIWIDSLCIIQDSQQDWELESSRMGDYYSNAFLTISAASSPNHSTPFLGVRNQSWYPVRFGVPNTKGKIHTILARLIPRYNNVTDIGVLFSRAWAWQESVLSPRTLYFTKSELIWECHDGVIPEHFFPPGQTTDEFGSARTLAMATSNRSDIISGQNSDKSLTPKSVWASWDKLVNSYTARLLTFETDRLPALSGIVWKYTKTTQSPYLAGLWEHSLPASLCWASYDLNWQGSHNSLDYQFSQYVAPSWSWASIRQRVEFQIYISDGFTPTCIILDAGAEVPGLNPFGRVSKAHLLLRGKVIQNHLRCNNPLEANNYELQNGERWIFRPDCVLAEEGGKILRSVSGKLPSSFSANVACIYLGVYSFKKPDIFGKRIQDVRFYFFLVLGQPNSNDSTFRRVGLAWSIVVLGEGVNTFKEILEAAPEQIVLVL